MIVCTVRTVIIKICIAICAIAITHAIIIVVLVVASVEDLLILMKVSLKIGCLTRKKWILLKVLKSPHINPHMIFFQMDVIIYLDVVLLRIFVWVTHCRMQLILLHLIVLLIQEMPHIYRIPIRIFVDFLLVILMTEWSRDEQCKLVRMYRAKEIGRAHV